ASFKIMMDLVLNHVSAESDWFRRYLRGEKRFEHLALEADPSNDLSRVVRPRAWPLLTEFRKDSGETVHLWTTFSADQIDLNFQDVNVLALMVEILLLYVEKGAAIIRLDAIAYLWKEVGTSCIHLPQTHEMVKLFRAILDAVSPGTLIITETNVPHAENISYFGTDFDEAQLVGRRKSADSLMRMPFSTLAHPMTASVYVRLKASCRCPRWIFWQRRCGAAGARFPIRKIRTDRKARTNSILPTLMRWRPKDSQGMRPMPEDFWLPRAFRWFFPEFPPHTFTVCWDPATGWRV
ncbi:MAG: alpha-amylase family glycosyl hydrolase, partial [Deltaproteobacteria bacterium]